MLICFYTPYVLRYNFSDNIFIAVNLPNINRYSFIFILWSVFIIISFKNRNLYTTDRGLSIPEETSRVVMSIFYASILIGAVIFFSKYKFFSRLVFFGNILMLCILLSGFRLIKRLILRRLILRGLHNINVLIVGAGKVGKILLGEIKKVPWWGFRVVGFLDDYAVGSINGISILGKIRDFSVVARRFFVDEVIVTIPSQRHSVSRLIKEAKALRLGIKMIPENFEESVSVIDISYLGFMPLISYKQRSHHPAEFTTKRIFDFVISLLSLITLLPLFIIIAILIKLDSNGPIFYIQKRVGFKGRLFNCYKFRSMVKNAEYLKAQLWDKNEIKGGVIFKIKEDPRITRIGRILRRYSLDELPQLINVLKGDMSLVGPRPPTPDEVSRYSHTQIARLSIRPGITGLSQIRGRSELTFRRWVKWDLWYINNWSFGLDLKILGWTIPSVLRGKGAY
jgi:exopolysaccharide biosynthesis polyprenyl glycosylphosphotransferase